MSLQGYSIVIVKPNIFVSTAQAYAGVTPAKPAVSLRDAIKRPVSEWKDLIVNDFEKSVFANYPQLQQLKDKMYELGAEYASMSGSGSAIYGIFSKPVANVEEHFPGIFCRQRDLI
jgi:4-diphosphocytidyl-2-C-methyl-D-erythritol kinase